MDWAKLQSRFQITDSSGVKCEKCRDVGWTKTIDARGFERFAECECKIKADNVRLIEKSGISEEFRKKRVRDFQTKGLHSHVSDMKQAAIQYLTNDTLGSICYLGSVGSGKTHMVVSIANALIDRGVPVRYMEYRTAIDSIKRNRLDEAYYHKQIMPYKNRQVLIVDDLYKGAVKDGSLMEADLAIMFDIINHRYFKRMPIIVSSEYTMGEIIELDEGIGSRIYEMCAGMIVQCRDDGLNYRTRDCGGRGKVGADGNSKAG